MQVLTGQWPKIYCHKFRVTHLDFKPNATNYGQFNLVTIPKATDVAFVKVWPRIAFLAPGAASIFLRVQDNWSIAPTANSNGSYLTTDLIQAVSNNYGRFQYNAPARSYYANTAIGVISSMTQPTTIIPTLVINGGPVINSLLAGSFDIWVGTIRLP